MSLVLKLGENPNLSNSEYHAETTHLSSSNLKTLLVDPQRFYHEKILGNKPPEVPKAHFLVGSYVHSAVLEPEKVPLEYAFFDGWRKAGSEYQKFLEQNQGKIVLSKPQKDVGDRLAKATETHKCVSQLLRDGAPELSLAAKILDVPLKMRADYINKDKAYIVDLKTTSHPTDTDIFKATIKEFSYDLSAALYCQIAYEVYGKLFDFYWIVVSKTDLGCAVYKASTNTLSAGSAEVTKALVLYKKCLNSGVWQLTSDAHKSTINTEDIIEI